MIPTLITAVACVVAGLFMGGCTPSSGNISKELLNRNAQLENQLTSTQSMMTGVAISAVILACGLGVSLYKRRKGGAIGKTKN